MRHRQTLGCGSPGAYRAHSAFAGGPASAHSAAYGSAKSGIGQVRTVPSASALARSLPSGLNATPVTLPPEPVPAGSLPSGLNATAFTLPPGSAGRGEPTGCLVAGFHSRTVPSPSAVASSLPFGLKATLLCPGKTPDFCRVTGFHSRTVPSPAAVASSVPSGLNATAFTPPPGSAGRGAPA